MHLGNAGRPTPVNSETDRVRARDLAAKNDGVAASPYVVVDGEAGGVPAVAVAAGPHYLWELHEARVAMPPNTSEMAPALLSPSL